MSEIAYLDARRHGAIPVDIDEPLQCRHCGSTWFRLEGRDNDPDSARYGAIAMTQGGRITAYTGFPVCLECGEPA